MKYRVTLLQLVHHEVEVEADEAADAQLKARTVARLNMADHYTIGYELVGCDAEPELVS